MATFEEQVGFTNDTLLRKRIRMATIIAAIEVQGEAIGSLPEAAFNKRQELARKVIQTAGLGTPTEDLARMFVWAVCSNGVVTPASPDGELQFVVNSVWSDCAGVTGNEV